MGGLVYREMGGFFRNASNCCSSLFSNPDISTNYKNGRISPRHGLYSNVKSMCTVVILTPILNAFQILKCMQR
jgi:hypothetical protein